MQIVYVLVNSMGILLGMYRERKLAVRAIRVYEKEATSSSPALYLYEVSSKQVNKFAANTFKCVWMTDPKLL